MATGTSSRDFAVHLACTSTSCCVADGLCLPFDFLKTRMQLQNELLPSSAPRLGPLSMAARILRAEGAAAFYAGFPAAMLRQASYGGLCFASYPHVRDALAGPQRDGAAVPLWSRVTAGALSGAGASAVANPTDVVKVRLQADGRLAMLGQTPRYEGALHAFRTVVKEEGFLALYKGVLPNMQRAIAVNGPGIAAFDHSKHLVGRLLGEEGSFRARFMASLVGGVVTALVGTPFDTMKTRMMNQPAGQPLYASTAHCAMATVRAPPMPPPIPSAAAATASLPPPLHALSRARAPAQVRVEGVLALWKGLLPVYCRQAPFNMLNYMLMETLLSTFAGRTI